MMTVKELNSKLQAFVSNIEKYVIDAVNDNEKKIVAMNQEQMQYGKNAEGEKIGYLRSLSYAQAKIDRGGLAPFRVPDLLLTGAFQGKMFLWTDGKQYEISSSDSKEPELVGKYGKIFGLMETFQEEARELTTKSLSKLFTQQTGVKG